MVYTGDRSQDNFLYFFTPLNSNQVHFKGNRISASGSSRKKLLSTRKKLEVFSVIPDLKGRKMLHDRIVPRETKYIEKLQQKDT